MLRVRGGMIISICQFIHGQVFLNLAFLELKTSKQGSKAILLLHTFYTHSSKLSKESFKIENPSIIMQ
jgi:hypothetical protein